MTNHDLITQVGGIERAREILEGAPEGCICFGGEDGDCDYYRDGEYFDTDYEMWMDIYFETPLLHEINDLRTAITSHKPKFKVGGLVVFDTTKPFCAKLPNDLMKYQQVSPNSKHDAIVWVGERMFEVGGKSIRHATPQEIKTGHRIELSGISGQLEVLDMIHVSPSCKVIER